MSQFDFGSGPVPAHRHRNPDGTEGGWVAETALVDPTAYISPDSLVWGDALIPENTRLCGACRVSTAIIVKTGIQSQFNNCEISGTAHTYLGCVFSNTRIVNNKISWFDIEITPEQHSVVCRFGANIWKQTKDGTLASHNSLGLLHSNPNIPTLIEPNGTQHFYSNGVRHRHPGYPAIQSLDGNSRKYFVHGIEVTQHESCLINQFHPYIDLDGNGRRLANSNDTPILFKLREISQHGYGVIYRLLHLYLQDKVPPQQILPLIEGRTEQEALDIIEFIQFHNVNGKLPEPHQHFLHSTISPPEDSNLLQSVVSIISDAIVNLTVESVANEVKV